MNAAKELKKVLPKASEAIEVMNKGLFPSISDGTRIFNPPGPKMLIRVDVPAHAGQPRLPWADETIPSNLRGNAPDILV